MLRTTWRAASLWVMLGTICALGNGPSARLVVEHDWAGRGQWLRADLHVHTKFSDGVATVGAIADRARTHGCDALAVTDHADRSLNAATSGYQSAIEAARDAHDDLVMLAGLEWNVPPRGGDDHVSLLVPPGRKEWATLAAFKERFDDFELGDRPKPDADEALRWLAGEYEGEPIGPVLIYNHPSRKHLASMEAVADLEGWRAVNDLVIGFEGAPGHQGDREIGSYSYAEKTIDRWDPATARPGDAWDTLLGRGLNVHGALSGSDFHNPNPRDLNDRWPCQFSETWLYVPEATESGVLRALRAGAFFGVHGHIAREVELSVNLNGLPRPATAGEVVELPAAGVADVSLRFVVPETDWEGMPNRIATVEFIAITPDALTVMPHQVSGSGLHEVSQSVPVGEHGVAIRARGRRVVPDGPDLMFYTNAVRIVVTRRGGL